MKGDISRATFEAGNHHRGVLMQQGRVMVDADWNEQQAIEQHHLDTLGHDVVGDTGAPRVRPGFEVVPQGVDLLIKAGRYYVDGVLCENDADVLFTQQRDLRRVDADLLPHAPGLYLAYLDVWERHITSIEDPAIREVALGGPDTTTRTRTVWQVRLIQVADPASTVRCDTPFPEWDRLVERELLSGTPGKLSARAQPQSAVPDPLCTLPPGAAYSSLENQLYRVEVHEPGDRAHATFKWSANNGTVASAIEPDDAGVVVRGSVVVIDELGKDAYLSFASDPLPEWVELSDDRLDLRDQRGVLAPVQSVDPATRRVTFAAGAVLPQLDAGQHPLIRRWDQAGTTAGANGVAMTGAWQGLDAGVEVRFEDGLYREGDFWLIPGRTSIGADGGDVLWPRDAAGPIPQPRHGTRHVLARLALVRLTATGFTRLPAGDCRIVFPPLTAIMAADVSYTEGACRLDGATTVQQAIDALCVRGDGACTVLVRSSDDLAAIVAGIPAGEPVDLCLGPGTWMVKEPVRIADRPSVRVTGAGPASRIVAAGSEAALVIGNCASVLVRDCHIESAIAARGGSSGLNGALTVIDCDAVTVEAVSLACAGGLVRAAACLTIRNSRPKARSRARVHGCDLAVGHLQDGVILLNVERSRVTDNMIRAGSRPPDDRLLLDPRYRALLRRSLVSNVRVLPAGGPRPPDTNASVTVGGNVVHFLTAPELVDRRGGTTAWERAIAALDPASVASPRSLERSLVEIAARLARGTGISAGLPARLVNAIGATLRADSPTVAQAVVVGGTLAADVGITGNSVADAIQGIHVGLSDASTSRVEAGVVVVRDNVVALSVPSMGTRDRHGIFVGNCNSLIVEDNYVSITRTHATVGLRFEGIRVFGALGRRAVVRQNHMASQFTVGVTFAPLNAPLPDNPLWIVTENEAEGASRVVDVPQRSATTRGVANSAAVRARVRGIVDNFA